MLRLAGGLLVVLCAGVLGLSVGDSGSSAAPAARANFEIYSVGINGGAKRNLTENPLPDSAPAVSPDGRRVVFLRLGDRGWDIWIMNSDGSGQRQLTSMPGYSASQPTWSPNGKLIAFVAEAPTSCSPHSCGELKVWVVRPDGTGLRKITGDTREDRPVDTRQQNPVWSPDGRRLLVEGHVNPDLTAGSLFVARLAGGGHILLRGGLVKQPSWSPDGRRVVFTASFQSPWGVWVIRSDGRGLRRLVTWGYQASWSPAGGQIAYRSDGSLVSVISARGGRAKRLAYAGGFAWDRRGRRLALFNTRRGIAVIDPDGRNFRVVTSDRAEHGQFEPDMRVGPWSWSRDGRRLFYATNPSETR